MFFGDFYFPSILGGKFVDDFFLRNHQPHFQGDF